MDNPSGEIRTTSCRRGEGNPALAKGVLAATALYNTSFNIGWTPLQVVYVGILPFTLRARVRYSEFFLETWLNLSGSRDVHFAVAVALIFN